MVEKFWDTEEHVAELEKNDRGEVVAVKLVSRANRRYVDVRNFYVNKGGNLAPGKGIAIPMDLANQIGENILKATRMAVDCERNIPASSDVPVGDGRPSGSGTEVDSAVPTGGGAQAVSAVPTNSNASVDSGIPENSTVSTFNSMPASYN